MLFHIQWQSRNPKDLQHHGQLRPEQNLAKPCRWDPKGRLEILPPRVLLPHHPKNARELQSEPHNEVCWLAYFPLWLTNLERIWNFCSLLYPRQWHIWAKRSTPRPSGSLHWENDSEQGRFKAPWELHQDDWWCKKSKTQSYFGHRRKSSPNETKQWLDGILFRCCHKQVWKLHHSEGFR